MRDQISINRMQQLNPVMQDKVKAFMEALENKGLQPRITQGLRTIAEQDALYAQGRTKPGKIVTNAKGGTSWHNYGVAIDIAFVNADGSINFNVSDEIGVLGEAMGFEWGHRWARWGIDDRPHFQLTGLPANPLSITKAQMDAIISSQKIMTQVQVPEVQHVSDWAQSAVDKAIKNGVATDWSRPQDPIDTKTLAIMLYRVGLLTVNPETTTDPMQQYLSKEKFAVVLDRLGKL